MCETRAEKQPSKISWFFPYIFVVQLKKKLSVQNMMIRVGGNMNAHRSRQTSAQMNNSFFSKLIEKYFMKKYTRIRLT